jgi:hypothetical protein
MLRNKKKYKVIDLQNIEFIKNDPERWQVLKFFLMVVGSMVVGYWIINNVWALTRCWWIALARLIGVME